MTRDTYPDIPTGSPEEFKQALATVVEMAIKDGVDVRGAWEFQTRGSTYNWEAEISELAKSFDTDDN